MTPEDIGWHQAMAAWVSAGAAIVQAVGSILAIVYAIRIAKRASEQAKAEVAAAVERERVAEAASAEREARATQVSLLRDENRQNEDFNRPIIIALAVSASIREEFTKRRDWIRENHRPGSMRLMATFEAHQTNQVTSTLERMQETASSTEINDALNKLKISIQSLSYRGSFEKDEILEIFSRKIVQIDVARDRVSALLRPIKEVK